MAEKRPQDDVVNLSASQNGVSSSINNTKSELQCPICFEAICEAHVTRCGHTFCYKCIIKTIMRFKRCPKCSTALSTEMVFPNYLLDDLITKNSFKIRLNENDGGVNSAAASSLTSGDRLKTLLTAESQKLTLPDVDLMLGILKNCKQQLEAESSIAQNRLLYDFLKHLLKQREEQQTQTTKEISLIKKDIAVVENILRCDGADSAVPNSITAIPKQDSEDFNFELPGSVNFGTSNELHLKRKRRMYTNFDDFVASYFSTRREELYLGTDGDYNMETDEKVKSNYSTQGLDVFRENLVKFSRYSSLRPLATINYSSDLHISSTIVSTIVFDKDNEFFAIGGVTKRIKVYDYMSVITDAVDIHYPCVEMVSNSKISCIAWNSYHKNILASSDYEGAVNIWDVGTGQRTKCFHEHEKRCWSVDFNDIDSRLIVSGSDDARVKLWSLNDDRSIATLEAKANVCCVKFNPKSSCHLAFGSADHDVHYYDLRNPVKPLSVFKGHKKAVSYVKFLNANEIVSASTDSQLKLWSTNSPPYCLRSFTGHINEKNFVGLATDGDYIACGSEDNSLFIYYKGLSKHLFNYKVNVGQRVTDLERSNDLNEFVSAVCWRKKCNVVVAANSRGLIKILELV